eukprot:5016566-Lingulodinium_polyedra.AAC.1
MWVIWAAVACHHRKCSFRSVLRMAPSFPALKTRSEVLTSKALHSTVGSTAPAAASTHCLRTR